MPLVGPQKQPGHSPTNRKRTQAPNPEDSGSSPERVSHHSPTDRHRNGVVHCILSTEGSIFRLLCLDMLVLWAQVQHRVQFGEFARLSWVVLLWISLVVAEKMRVNDGKV
ncbi:hypothetical protein Pint_19590 [Pistacia integerrima]|uniref:Uncharacterized protein n=1 Tax=Pistacia integerrima TaxID=434235 RepID=A0ACC0XC43_9ROSI|nr:hypothetical protein Pint_19590 [Pistacia integerrima]